MEFVHGRLYLASRLVNLAKKLVNGFHRRPRSRLKGPTTFHKAPQVVRDMGLPIRSRGALFVVDPCVNDISFILEVGEGWGLGDTLEYQQCE